MRFPMPPINGTAIAAILHHATRNASAHVSDATSQRDDIAPHQDHAIVKEHHYQPPGFLGIPPVFGENILKALAIVIESHPDNHTNGTDHPLLVAMNATIHSILNPTNLTVTLSNSTDDKLEPRGSPYAWEKSGGRRLPPCPGWPAKQRYNATHWREWTFFHGYEYGLLDPKCPVSNGGVGI
ncbi:uncharacterized protein LY89DRAFT_686658 [Mollisia scopiformis]|uniref:Uncharacterized protein n=1 Tax=Mollisia scopiformis TaxID=149040 RepID=A0A194X4K3_MOLSC|nr:uncharacterized protein LY89DRAFT_686658 [Mollisia scopiformis]KUJ15110.1 hypothetical protein LY89DRAFT_686658 [Mollisia scopiformis]